MVPVPTAEQNYLRRRGEAIISALTRRHGSLRLCLLAAGVRLEDAEALLVEAIESVRSHAWLSSNPDRLLVQALDSICALYAEARAIPYRMLLQLLQRQGSTIDLRMRKAGFSLAASETVLRTLVRTTPRAEWSEAESPDLLFLAKLDAICSAHARSEADSQGFKLLLCSSPGEKPSPLDQAGQNGCQGPIIVSCRKETPLSHQNPFMLTRGK